MSQLSDVFHELVMKEFRRSGTQPLTLLRRLMTELREANVPLQDDAVCYTMAIRLWGGTIAQLTNEDDPGYINRAGGATEGFTPHDLCDSTYRKGRGLMQAVRTFLPAEFLAQDRTGTLLERSQRFENTLIELMQSKLNTVAN